MMYAEGSQAIFEEALELLKSLPEKEPREQIEAMSLLYRMVTADPRLRSYLAMRDIIQ